MTAANRASFWQEHGTHLMVMGAIALLLLPLLNFFSEAVSHQGLRGNYAMRIRWVAHRYVLRQSMDFFTNDFAGRVATKVMQTALGVRDAVMKFTEVLVYVIVYFFGALFLVGVLFAGSRFEMNPSLFIGAVLFQIVISEPHVSDKSVATARIPFEYGIPDLDGFIGFVCIHAGITRFYQFGCCSVFNDGASQTSGRRLSLA